MRLRDKAVGVLIVGWLFCSAAIHISSGWVQLHAIEAVVDFMSEIRIDDLSRHIHLSASKFDLLDLDWSLRADKKLDVVSSSRGNIGLASRERYEFKLWPRAVNYRIFSRQRLDVVGHATTGIDEAIGYLGPNPCNNRFTNVHALDDHIWKKLGFDQRLGLAIGFGLDTSLLSQGMRIRGELRSLRGLSYRLAGKYLSLPQTRIVMMNLSLELVAGLVGVSANLGEGVLSRLPIVMVNISLVPSPNTGERSYYNPHNSDPKSLTGEIVRCLHRINLTLFEGALGFSICIAYLPFLLRYFFRRAERSMKDWDNLWLPPIAMIIRILIAQCFVFLTMKGLWR
jgi:hypothetical protein